MKNWIRILLIAVLILSTGLVAMPESAKEKIPFDGLRNFLLSRTIHYGLDLAGGSQLDFKVDLTRVREKIAAGESITEDDIINGVQATLERRIDPDGTRELNVYSADFGDEKHIFVELTADIDTPETREKLQKHIDLQFKKLKETADESEKEAARLAAEEALSLAGSGTSLADIEQQLNDRKTAKYVANLKESEKKFKDQLPKNLEEKLWNTTPGDFVPEVIAAEGAMAFDQYTNQLKPIEGFSIYRAGIKEIVDRKKTEPGEDFDTVAKEVSIDDKREQSITELSDELQNEVITKVQPNGISEIVEDNGKFIIYKLLKATEESGGARVAQIVLSDRQVAEETRQRVIPQETTTPEEQITYDELFIEIVPDPWEETGLDGEHFKIAKVSTDQTNMPVTSIEFDDEGAKMFEELTSQLIGKPMAIFVGGDFISAPIIQERIAGGAAQISFNQPLLIEAQKEAISLARDLNAGAIPAPVHLDGEMKVAASLGIEALDISIKAAAIGLILLSLWIIFSYRILGIFAVISLAIYGILFLFILKFSSIFVLTLAGIAGLILSIGMAVDANVLIFERMREELRAEKNFSTAIAIGFDRAWTSIRDANLTTLIVCGILYVMGTSIIKGFAIMLAIGVLLSMFTAVTITRTLLRTLVGTKIARKRNLITKL